jgi:hypothetical protein
MSAKLPLRLCAVQRGGLGSSAGIGPFLTVGVRRLLREQRTDSSAAPGRPYNCLRNVREPAIYVARHRTVDFLQFAVSPLRFLVMDLKFARKNGTCCILQMNDS